MEKSQLILIHLDFLPGERSQTRRPKRTVPSEHSPTQIPIEGSRTKVTKLKPPKDRSQARAFKQNNDRLGMRAVKWKFPNKKTKRQFSNERRQSEVPQLIFPRQSCRDESFQTEGPDRTNPLQIIRDSGRARPLDGHGRRC